MNDRRKEEVYCDFKIVASGKFFPVHRLVLHSSSDYFRAMLTPGMKETTQGYCEFNEEAAVVEQCIEFMYTGKMNLQLITVVEILRLSHQWLLDGAVAICSKFMQNNISNETCIMWINLSKLYELSELESPCMTFLLQNLSNVKNIHELEYQTLQSLINKPMKRPNHAKVLWNVLKARIQRPGSENPCTLIQAFRVEGLTEAEYKASLLKHNHILLCKPCNMYVTMRREAHSYRSEDIKIGNCLAMKNQVIQFGALDILPALDRFIVKHFNRISMRKEFLTLVTEEHFLSYIRKIQRHCTEEEFERIVGWLRHTPERESSFSVIFLHGRSSSSKFTKCLQTLKTEHDNTILSDPSTCCYLSYLAAKYNGGKILEETEYFIHWNFQKFSSCTDIAYLSVETMERYARTESLITPNGGLTIWTAVRLWGQNEHRNSKDDFSRVFCSLLFEKFPLSSLQSISNDPLVKKSIECCTKLLEATLSRISENRCIVDTHKTMVMPRISSCEEKLKELKNQYELVGKRNSKRWKYSEDRIHEIEESGKSQWQYLNQENVAIQKSLTRLKDSVYQSATVSSDKFEILKRENEELTQRIYTLERYRNKFQNEIRTKNGMVERSIKIDMERSKDALQSDISQLREEHDSFRKVATVFVIGCAASLYCYKIFVHNPQPAILPLQEQRFLLDIPLQVLLPAMPLPSLFFDENYLLHRIIFSNI